jgi:hypothetical protein
MNDLDIALKTIGYTKITEKIYNNHDKWIQIIPNEKSIKTVFFNFYISFPSSEIILYLSEERRLGKLINELLNKNYGDEYGIYSKYHQPYSLNLTKKHINNISTNIISGNIINISSIKNSENHLNSKFYIEISIERNSDIQMDSNEYQIYHELTSIKMKNIFKIDNKYSKYFDGVIYCFYTCSDGCTVLYFNDEQCFKSSLKIVKEMQELQDIQNECKMIKNCELKINIK